MDLEICSECGKIFYNISDNSVCENCIAKQKKQIKEVRNYIRKNSNADIEEVIEKCEVERNQIYEWVRNGELRLEETSPIDIPCVKCGDSIKSGSLCAKCQLKKNEIIMKLDKAFNIRRKN